MAVLSDVTAVTISHAPNIHRFGSGGVSKRVAGTDDWTVMVTQKAQGGGPDVTAGTSSTSGKVLDITEVTSGRSFQGPAICMDVTYNYDQDTGAPVEYVYTFAAQGAAPTQAGGSADEAFSSKDAVVTWDDTP